MKKAICIFMITLMITGVFAGCQKTQESPIVIGKNNEMMIEKAHDIGVPEDDIVHAEQYNIPQRFSFAKSEADGKLVIEVDAEVFVPDYPMPIVRVEVAQFSQDTVSALYEAFLGDTPMIETIDTLTKSQIEELLIFYQKVMADENADASDKDFAESYIEDLTAKYETAPKTIETTPATSELKYMTETFDGHATVHYYGINASSEDGKHYFQVRNDRDNEQAIEWTNYDKNGKPSGGTIIPVMRNAHISYVSNTPSGNYNYVVRDDSLRMNRGDVLPGYAQESLRLSPEEAATAVELLLKKTGLGDMMAIAEICLMGDKDTTNGVPISTNYAYSIECTRLVRNVPCANMRSTFIQTDTALAPMWAYESCTFQINDSGVFYFSWSAPMQINETVVEKASLKHFSEIEDIVKKMLPIAYEPEARDQNIKSIKLEIDSMTLSLQRIAEKNSFDRAMLVPAWNVYGLYTRAGDGYSNTERRALLTINAIDGSIIDARKGY